jgi:hypothetical protein
MPKQPLSPGGALAGAARRGRTSPLFFAFKRRIRMTLLGKATRKITKSYLD